MKNQILITGKGEEERVSQTIFIATIVKRIKTEASYSFCYKIIWTIDLDWGG